MYFWKQSGSKPHQSARRSNRRAGLTPRDSDRLEIKDGYWANYYHKVLVCAAGGLSSLLLLIVIRHHIYYMGGAAPLYFGFLVLCFLTSLLLPFYWAYSYRRMMDVFNEDEDIELPDARPLEVEEEFVISHASGEEAVEEAAEAKVEQQW